MNRVAAQIPSIDSRSAEDVAMQLAQRAPGYVQRLNVGDYGQASAIIQVAAEYAQTLIQRLNQVPLNDKLRFLEMMGMRPNPATSSEATLVFTLASAAATVTLPAGSQVVASGNSTQIYFETLQSTAIVATTLAQVATVSPATDQWTDHTPDLQNNTPFTLWATNTAAAQTNSAAVQPQLMSHYLYIGDDTLLAFEGIGTITVGVNNVFVPASSELKLAWEYTTDGSTWNAFTDANVSDGTAGLTQAGSVTLTLNGHVNGDFSVPDSKEKKWIRMGLAEAMSADPGQRLPQIGGITLTSSYGLSQLPPDAAFSDTTKLDTSATFYPLSAQPRPGSLFYVQCDKALGKPGASVTAAVMFEPTPQGTAANAMTPIPTAMTPALSHSYSTATGWQSAGVSLTWLTTPIPASVVLTPTAATYGATFTVPDDIAQTTVNQVKGFWLRLSLDSGGLGYNMTIPLPTNTAHTNAATYSFPVTLPVAASQLQFGYSYAGNSQSPELVAVNDGQSVLYTATNQATNLSFYPFGQSQDQAPALYLGFSNPFPDDVLGVFFDIANTGVTSPGTALVWEQYDVSGWIPLSAADSSNPDPTRGLTTSGIINVITTSQCTAWNRFANSDAKPLYWLRARTKSGAAPASPTINNISINAVQAKQQRTITNEPMGTGNGTPSNTMNFQQFPVLDGENVMVQELSGARADTEWRLVVKNISNSAAVVTQLESLVAAEGTQTQITLDNFMLVRDRNKVVTEVWVRWNYVDAFYAAKPGDRVYTLDRPTGKLMFGDNEQGMALGNGMAVKAAFYQTGGGSAGNVAANSITQLLSPASGVQQVTNPEAADGGSDAETALHFAQRAPRRLLSRGRLVLPADFEVMAMEASNLIAAAYALPCINPSMSRAAGWITLIIIPDSTDPQPQPSTELCESVYSTLITTAPADVRVTGQLNVIGPTYTAVDVRATLAPSDPSNAPDLEASASALLTTFLHPLEGGVNGTGWSPGQDVYLSDVAAALQPADGLGCVRGVAISVNGVEQDRIAVGAMRIACAGKITVSLAGS